MDRLESAHSSKRKVVRFPSAQVTSYTHSLHSPREPDKLRPSEQNSLKLSNAENWVMESVKRHFSRYRNSRSPSNEYHS